MHDGISDIWACQALCAQNDDCKWFAYRHSSGRCWLKTQKGYKEAGGRAVEVGPQSCHTANQIANSIPGVKAATMGELTVTGLEVKMATTTQTHDTAIKTSTVTSQCGPGHESDEKGGCRKCASDLVSPYGGRCRECGILGWVPNDERSECVEELESCKPCSDLKILVASNAGMSATDRECYQQCQADDANSEAAVANVEAAEANEQQSNSYTLEIIGAVVGVLSLIASVGVATKWWSKCHAVASEDGDVENCISSVAPGASRVDTPAEGFDAPAHNQA